MTSFDPRAKAEQWLSEEGFEMRLTSTPLRLLLSRLRRDGSGIFRSRPMPDHGPRTTQESSSLAAARSRRGL